MLCLMGVMSSSFAGITITQDGTIIENQYISGQVNVKAHNVIIRNCELDGGGTSLYGVSSKYYDSNGQPYKGALIENCHIHDYGVGVLAHYTTIRRCNIHDSQTDAIKARSGCLIERNWCHHLGKKVGAHADCVQIRGGSNIIIRYNHFDIPISQTEKDTPEYKRPWIKPKKVKNIKKFIFPKKNKVKETIFELLKSPNLTSKKWIWEQYDHMVMCDTIKPPSYGAAIVRVHGTNNKLNLEPGMRLSALL